jgi:CBS domain-containing protein
MQPLDEIPVLPPGAPAERALDEFARGDVEQLAVVEHDHMVGLVSRGDLVKWLAFRPGSKPGAAIAPPPAPTQ